MVNDGVIPLPQGSTAATPQRRLMFRGNLELKQRHVAGIHPEVIFVHVSCESESNMGVGVREKKSVCAHVREAFV